MLRSLKDLEHYAVTATDGDVGSVVNFLFDDERWVVRHLVVDTGNFLDGRHPVLISPISFHQADWATRHFHLSLTKDKIKHSPSVDVDKPVSRQHESDYYGYYKYPSYWESSGMGAYPGLSQGNPYGSHVTTKPSDVHLRSAREVRRYHVQGTDQAIGHIDDFIVDDVTWEVRYLVINTTNWWFGKKVLVSPHWTSRISWLEDTVHVDLSRQQIKDSPEWKPDAGVNREYEARLYDYYGRPVYWDPQSRTADVAPSRVITAL